VAMSRTPDPRHRVLMLSLLREIGSFADSDVFNVLKGMAKKDPNERVAAMAEGVLMHLLERQTAADLGARVEAAGRRPEGGRAADRPDPRPGFFPWPGGGRCALPARIPRVGRDHGRVPAGPDPTPAGTSSRSWPM
jgi:hypothetical protein